MPPSDHSGLDASHLTETELVGLKIYDLNEDQVGSISHVHGLGPDMQVVADVGTFLGMFGKSVAIPASALGLMQDRNGTMRATTAWTKHQIEALPAHSGP